MIAPGSTERWDRECYPERGPRRYDSRARGGHPRRHAEPRMSDGAIAVVCVLIICVMGLMAWLGMMLTQQAPREEAELPTRRVTHDSMCATNTYDGELIRWYVMTDPDYRIQYLVNDRGGCCVRLDSNGNVMGVSDGAGETGGDEQSYDYDYGYDETGEGYGYE